MDKPTVVHEHCFAYSLWSGHFCVYEGELLDTQDGYYFFLSKENKKRLILSKKEKTVFNANVWMSTRDDKLARKLLIKHQEKQIAALQEKINNHLQKIKILKEQE